MSHEHRMLHKSHRVRLVLLIAMTFATYGAIVVKLYWLQIVRHGDYAGLAEYQQHRTQTFASQRGDIVDRNGRLLAGSHATQTIILDTRKSVVLDTGRIAGKPKPLLIEELARLTGRSEEKVRGYFAKDGRYILEKQADEKGLKAYDTLQAKLDLPEGAILYKPENFEEAITVDKSLIKGGDLFELMVRRLAGALGKPADFVRNCFAHPKRTYVYRKAPDNILQAVNVVQWQMGLPDTLLVLENASKRDYPNGPLASHLLGCTTIDKDGSDNSGQTGLEAFYNETLNGDTRSVRMLAGGGLRRSVLTEISDEAIQSTFGNSLELTIDQQIQTFAETALSRAVAKFQALSGVVVVMDVPTGEVLALANCPDFDPNNRSDMTDADRMRNRALTDPREVGSVMKIITSSLMIDSGLLSPDEMVNCHDGSAWVGGRVIRDSHPLSVIPFRDAFAESSNIAMASLADARLEPNAYYQGLQRFGVGKLTGIDLPEESAGVLRPVARWTAMSKASLAIGYETSLTPLQVVAALGAIGNGGQRMRPHVVRAVLNAKGEAIRRVEPEELGRVVSPETCKTLLNLMEGVVLHGTASKEGKVPGYRVGGKTGTTVKRELDENGAKTYIASFAGLAPIENPKLAIYIYVDAPKGAKYGGDVAAPIFREIAWQTLQYLMVRPSDEAAYNAYKSLRENGRQMQTPAELLADASRNPQSAAPAMPIDVDQSESDIDFAEAPPLPRPALPGLEAEAVVATGPRMPDCSGLTILEAWEKLGKVGIQARMLGSGVATSQEPAAGMRIAKGQEAKVVFANLSEPRLARKTSGAPVALKIR